MPNRFEQSDPRGPPNHQFRCKLRWPESSPTKRAGECGRALLAHAERTLHAEGAARAELWTLEANARARRIYTEAGWQADGARRETPFGPGSLTEVRFLKTLA